jgi:parvulin-like peptidyl-prolyl isomerase
MRVPFVFIALAAALLAGCGSGGSSAKLSSDDIAVVGKTHISAATLDKWLARDKLSYQSQGKTFPKEGTTDFETIRAQLVSSLVQQAELADEARSMGIHITNAAIDQRLALLKKTYFGGSEKRYLAGIKKNGFTDAQIREDVIRPQLVSEALQNAIVKNVKVSDSDVHAYYVSHLQQYSQPESRDVRYILVGSNRALAQSVYTQLRNGNAKTWCRLAKKYAKDSSGKTCGKATFTKGQTVPVFDKAAFSTPAGKVVPPFYDPTQYKAWFVIEPLGPVKKSTVTPEKQVAASIRQSVLDQKKQQAESSWLAGLKKSYCSGSRIRYQAGYTASPDPCASSTTTNATTTG